MVLPEGIQTRLIGSRGDLGSPVSEQTHPRDGMFKGNMAHYLSCGRDALFNIALARTSANVGAPTNILDFACGFGRVARHLRSAFPDAAFTFTDVMPDASAFCAATFSGADKPINKDFSAYAPGREFDLIWVGSLFTHLTEAKSKALIGLLLELTARNGVIVFTSHGRYVRERRKNETWPYAIDAAQYDAMIDQCHSTGYGFTGYNGSADYGISLASLGWWERLLGNIGHAEIVMLRERGWDRHQDVIAVKRSG